MLKKTLFIGAALGALCVSHAQAQTVTTKQPFTVSINGDIRYYLGYTSASPKSSGVGQAHSDGMESGFDARLTLTAAARADNGLRYGFLTRFRNNQEKLSSTGAAQDTLGADRKMIFLEGGWGRVELGDYYGASTSLEVVAPTRDYGFIQDTSGTMKWTNYGSYFSRVWHHQDTAWTRLTYLTPKLSGLQAGVTYAPDYNESGRNLTRDNARYDDMVEVAAKYDATLAGVKMQVGAGYAWAARTNNANGELSVFNVGAKVFYEGFGFGVAYWDNNGTGLAKVNNQEQDVHGWNAALTYETGPWVAGLSYTSSTRELPTRRFRDVDTEMWTIGGGYKLAPGMMVQLDLGYVDVQDWSSTSGSGTYFENDAVIVATRTTLKF